MAKKKDKPDTHKEAPKPVAAAKPKPTVTAEWMADPKNRATIGVYDRG